MTSALRRDPAWSIHDATVMFYRRLHRLGGDTAAHLRPSAELQTFDYRQLVVEAGATTDVVVVALTVANTGDRLGDEMVQLYVRDDVASVARPSRQLVGFTRVALEPGESHDVRFSIHPSRLAFYDPAMRFVTEPGTSSVPG